MQADFEKVVRKDIEDLIYEQKTLKRIQLAEDQRAVSQDVEIDEFMKADHKKSQLITQNEKLNAKLEQMQKRFEHQQSILKNLQENSQATEKLL